MSKLSRVLIFPGRPGTGSWCWMALVASRTGSRAALRRYKAGLRAKGEKLTYAELMQGRLTNVVDTQAIITNAIAKLGGRTPQPGLSANEEMRKARAGKLSRGSNPPLGLIQPVGPSRPRHVGGIGGPDAGGGGHLTRHPLGSEGPGAGTRGPARNMLTTSRVSVMAIDVMEEWLKVAAENDLNHGRLEEALRNLEALAGLAIMEALTNIGGQRSSSVSRSRENSLARPPGRRSRRPGLD